MSSSHKDGYEEKQISDVDNFAGIEHVATMRTLFRLIDMWMWFLF